MLLKGEIYVTNLRAEIPTFKQKYNDVDLSLKWDLIKMEIRGLTIKYSKNKAKKRKSAEIYFQNKINQLYKMSEKHPNNKQIINEIYYTRSRLKNIMQHNTKGTILRSKVRWHEHGGRNTILLWLSKNETMKKRQPQN